MSTFPAITGPKLIKILKKFGFIRIRQRGSNLKRQCGNKAGAYVSARNGSRRRYSMNPSTPIKRCSSWSTGIQKAHFKQVRSTFCKKENMKRPIYLFAPIPL